MQVLNELIFAFHKLHFDNAMRIGLEACEPSEFPFEHLFTIRTSHCFLCRQMLKFFRVFKAVS